MSIKEQTIKKSALTPTVLIAGGAGFIGSHLAESLIVKGSRVVVLDNFKTGKDIYVNSLLENPKFALFDADINQGIPKEIQSVDYIIHLAGVESYLYNRDQMSLDSLLTNALGTKHLLDLAHRSDAKFLLVSSIDVYQGRISPMDLDDYFGHTPEEEKRYSLSEAKRYAEALVWEYYKKFEVDVRIARISEVYGPRMNLGSSGKLGHMVGELLENKDLTIVGEGTEKEFYTYITDTVSGLVKTLFSKNTDGKIYTLAADEPVTPLEIAYALKTLADRSIEIKFKSSSDGTPPDQKIPSRGDLQSVRWEAKTSLPDGLRKTIEWFGYEPSTHSFRPNKIIDAKKKAVERQDVDAISSLVTAAEKPKELVTNLFKQKEEKPVTKPPQTKKQKNKKERPFTTPNNKTHKIAAVLIALALVLLFPPIHFGVTSYLGYRNLVKSGEQMMQLDSEKAVSSAEKAFKNLTQAKKSLRRVGWVFAATDARDNYASTLNLLNSSIYTSKSVYNIAKASEPFGGLWESIRPTSDAKLDESQFSGAQANLREAGSNIQLSLASLKNVDEKKLPGILRTKLNTYAKGVALLEKNIDSAAVLAGEIPNLLGVTEKQTYMVLFQNNNEIRPTGGFIGSYALVEFENGKITALSIDDIYNPDGQIDERDIQNEPIPLLAELLGEDRQYIRNANWSPDFPTSALDIKKLYEQATGTKINGIVAVDLYFVQKLLDVTGPVYLTAYAEEISSENIYERTQYYSEFNYENGSSQKKDFLTILGSKLLENLLALPEDDITNLLIALNSSVTERHLTLTLFDSAFNAELEKNNLDGSLVSTNTDYLQVVNANVGGTKANYFVQNEMNYTVSSETRDGILRGKLELVYKHTGTSTSWPSGPYKDYVRVLTPAGTKLTNASLQGEDIFEEVAIDRLGNYNSFEYLIEVNPQDTVTLTFYYDLDERHSIDKENMGYSLYWQKQAGTQNDKVRFSFMSPFGTEAIGDVNFSGELNTDKIFDITVK